MQRRTFICQSRVPVIEEIIPGKPQILGYSQCVAEHKHNVPIWLTLDAHLIAEDLLEDTFRIVLSEFSCYSRVAKILLLPYDFAHGWLCGYSMEEIMAWWCGRERED